MKPIFFRIVLLLSCFNHQITFSQDGDLDLSFNPPVHLDYPDYNGSYDGRIYCTKILSDGKILIYGNIDDYLGQEVHKLFRIFPDGRLDSTFDVGIGPDSHDVFINQNSNAIHVQDDGKILVGGNFTSFNNVPRKKVVRLNTNGSVDLTFNAGGGNFDGMILTIETQTDGKIICGGIFTEFNGSTKNNLVRLNANGTLDNTFNIGAGFSYYVSMGTEQSSYVNDIEILNDNKIIVGGYFNRYKGVLQKGVICLNSNGTKDTSFLIGTGTNEIDVVRKMYVNPLDEKIYLAGSISHFNGVDTSNIIRLNSDGTLDTTFSVTQNIVSNVFNSGISDFGVLSNGNIIVSGDFTLNELQDLAMYDEDGELVESFQFSNDQSPNNPEIYCLSVADNDAIYVSGYFKNINQIYNSKGSIVKIQPDGETDLSFNPNYGSIGDTPISKCFQLNDGTILLSSTGQYNERKTTSIIKVDTNGAVVENDYDNFKILPLYGHQYKYNNQGGLFVLSSLSGVYKILENGLIDNTFTTTQGLIPTFNAFKKVIAIQSDDKIIIGGNFKLNSSTQYRKRIFRVTYNGVVDDLFDIGKGFNGTATTNTTYSVNCLEVQPDDKILAGGKFTDFNDTPCNNFTRLNADGSLDQAFNTILGTGFNDEIKDILLQADGKIVVAGFFNTLNNSTAHYITRLNSDGTIDNTFNSPFLDDLEFNRVTKVKILENGKYIVSAIMDGVQKLLRLNSDGSIDATFFNENVFLKMPYPDNNINYVDLIRDIAILDNSKILVVGGFYKVNDIIRQGFAQFNYDNGLSIDDITDNSKQTIFLTPNPVDDFVTVKSTQMFNEVKIFDISGKFIKGETLMENRCNLSSLKPGVYILKLDNNKSGLKFIKK